MLGPGFVAGESAVDGVWKGRKSTGVKVSYLTLAV